MKVNGSTITLKTKVKFFKNALDMAFLNCTFLEILASSIVFSANNK